MVRCFGDPADTLIQMDLIRNNPSLKLDAIENGLIQMACTSNRGIHGPNENRHETKKK